LGTTENTTLEVRGQAALHFSGEITNMDICTSSVVLTVVPFYGVASVVFQAGSFVHSIFDASAPTNGVNPVSICCEELRQVAGNWTGQFSLIVFLESGYGKFTVLSPTVTTLLPVSRYFSLVPVSLSCDGKEIICNASYTGCPINVSPTDDHLYSFWASTM